MKLFKPVNHAAWPAAARLLETITSSDPTSITGDILRHTITELYFTFTGRRGDDKFTDIPPMLTSMPPEVVNQFLMTTFPVMCADVLIAQGPMFGDQQAPVPCLPGNVPKVISFTPVEAYTLLSMSFLCIPLIAEDGRPQMADGTCHLFFTNRPRLVAKFHCLINYFNVIVAAKTRQLPAPLCAEITGDNRRIELERIVSPKIHGAEWWCSVDAPLSPIEVRGDFQRIESARVSIHADFANMHVGGGVLRKGCVQEEIRFMISPESLVSVLLCDAMADNEAVLIRNTIQFSDYTGYASSFKCLGFSKSLIESFQSDDHISVPLDDILCIDAIPFGLDTQKQYSLTSILRELEKCRIGLSGECTKPFATGNWGCGVFGGDTQLKAVIQWLACSANGIPMIFFPFDDTQTSQLSELYDLATRGNGLTVGRIFEYIVRGLANGAIGEANTINYLIKTIRATIE